MNVIQKQESFSRPLLASCLKKFFSTCNNEILKVKSNFQTLLADPDGNVIFELNKAEIDDAHKDKQKMFNENFKVRLAFKD